MRGDGPRDPVWLAGLAHSASSESFLAISVSKRDIYGHFLRILAFFSAVMSVLNGASRQVTRGCDSLGRLMGLMGTQRDFDFAQNPQGTRAEADRPTQPKAEPVPPTSRELWGPETMRKIGGIALILCTFNCRALHWRWGRVNSSAEAIILFGGSDHTLRRKRSYSSAETIILFGYRRPRPCAGRGVSSFGCRR